MKKNEPPPALTRHARLRAAAKFSSGHRAPADSVLAAMSLNLPARPALLWTVRIISSLAMAVCFVITVMKLNGTISSLRGCGAEGGCTQVIGGRWSEWFGIPVAAWAGVVYLVVVVLTLPAVRQVFGRKGDQLLAAAGVVLAGAAIYFISLMAFAKEDGGYCPWCLALHAAGLTVAVILLTAAVQRQREGERGVLESAMLTGFMVIGILAAGQVWGPKPDTHLVTQGGLKSDAGGNAAQPAATRPDAAAPGGNASRIVTFFKGELTYDAAALPILGKPDARAVLVEYFDYTCSSCRTLAEDLKALKKKWPGIFSVIVLPTPLNRSCNPFLRDNIPDHEGACDLAKLSLALWKVKPEAFEQYHYYLLALPLPANSSMIQTARRKADELAGAAAMDAALEDDHVANQLRSNLGTFAKLTAASIRMPKLLLHTEIMMHGPARDKQTFITVMEQQFGLTGAGIPVVSTPK